MVNYLTLAVCCVSACLLGGLATAVYFIFHQDAELEKFRAMFESLKEAGKRNQVAPAAKPFDLFEFLDKFPGAKTTVTEETRTTRTAVPRGYKCPVENCRIQTAHSHTEDFVRRIKEK